MFIVAVLFLMAVAAGGFALWTRLGQTGSSDLENWIGRQVAAVLEGYITPKVSFESIDYEAPYAVTLEELTLTADDRKIILVDRIFLELAEIPRAGAPLKIQRIELDGPQARFIRNGDGGFVGWSGFVRPEVQQDPDSVPSGGRFSDVLRLRSMVIRGGRLLYDDAVAGGEPMVLSGIDLRFDTPPLKDQPGCYALTGVLSHKPLFHVDVDAEIDLDKAVLGFNSLKFEAVVGEAQYAALPPAVQDLLRRHRVRGELSATVEGELPLLDPKAATLNVASQLRNGYVSHGDVSVPIGQLDVRMKLPGDSIDVSAERLTLAHGEQPLVEIGKLVVAMSGIGQTEAPFTIPRIQITGPRVHLKRSPGGGFVGWGELTESFRPDPPSTGQEKTGPQNAVPLRKLEIRDASVIYTPVDGEPIDVPGVNLDLALQPSPQTPEWLDITGELSRLPIAKVSLEARADLTESVLNVASFQMRILLGESEIAALPAGLQQALRDRRVTGRFDANAKGRFWWDDPPRSTGLVQTSLRDARIVHGEMVIPVEHFAVKVRVDDGIANGRYDAALLGGKAHGAVRLELADPQPFRGNWIVTDAHLEEILQAVQGGRSKYAGRVDAKGNVRGEAIDLPATLSGAGEVDIQQGRLGKLPIVEQLTALVVKNILGLNRTADDTARIEFRLASDHVDFRKVLIDSSVFKLRGTGRVYYDTDLDMNFGVDGKGKIGDLLSPITGAVVTYGVTGTLNKPKIIPKPLGIGN
jgi:hypothetical protein